MRAVAAVMVCATLLIPAAAQQREPIIDVHMHALAADAQGPPPLAMCTPFPEYPAWDPVRPYADLFIAKFKKPACRIRSGRQQRTTRWGGNVVIHTKR